MPPLSLSLSSRPLLHNTMGTARHAIRPMFARGKWRLLRGDTVQIMAGRDKGQTGVIARVIRDDKKPGVVVEGRNLVSGAGAGGERACAGPY